MTNTTLDAAIEAAGNAIVEAASARLKRRGEIGWNNALTEIRRRAEVVQQRKVR